MTHDELMLIMLISLNPGTVARGDAACREQAFLLLQKKRLCARVRACAGAAESLHTYIYIHRATRHTVGSRLALFRVLRGASGRARDEAHAIIHDHDDHVIHLHLQHLTLNMQHQHQGLREI